MSVRAFLASISPDVRGKAADHNRCLRAVETVATTAESSKVGQAPRRMRVYEALASEKIV